MADIPDDGRALATVVIVSRDEYDLLDDFLTYHSAIFGAANVVVVDNGSTDMRLCPIVQRHRDLGVRFVQDRRPFCDAAAFMTEHMRALAPACRFLLPLETDEFVFSIEQTGSHEYGTDASPRRCRCSGTAPSSARASIRPTPASPAAPTRARRRR